MKFFVSSEIRESPHFWGITGCIAGCLFVIAQTIPVRNVQQYIFVQHSVFVDTVVLRPFRDIMSMTTYVVSPSTSIKLKQLEYKVQSLEAEKIVFEEELRQYQQVSSILASNSGQKNQVTPAILIRSGEKWFVTNNNANLVSRAPIVIRNAYLGYVDENTNGLATARLWSTGDMQVGALHQRSREIGVVKKDQNVLVIEFFSKVVDIKVGDAILTMGNQEGVPVAFPLALVQKDLTRESDPFTRVQIKPMATVSSGDMVGVFQESR